MPWIGDPALGQEATQVRRLTEAERLVRWAGKHDQASGGADQGGCGARRQVTADPATFWTVTPHEPNNNIRFAICRFAISPHRADRGDGLREQRMPGRGLGRL